MSKKKDYINPNLKRGKNFTGTRFYTAQELFDGLNAGDTIDLARAITLIESNNHNQQEQAQALIQKCITTEHNSIRIGITGVPGVGKSTFIETFGMHLIQKGHKVAVLAVDPTSSVTKGSILGDKTRMEQLAKAKNAFIRPSPANDSLGGVTKKTKESILLCETAGYDIILVETVGVGQSETAVHGMVDFFLLLKLAGAGDELQGIKRGIMEMADGLIITKADGDNLNMVSTAMNSFKRALHLYPPKANGWSPKVLSCSALEKTGIQEIAKLIFDYVLFTKENNSFFAKRIDQNKEWFLSMVKNNILDSILLKPDNQKRIAKYLNQIDNNKIAPYSAAIELVKQISYTP